MQAEVYFGLLLQIMAADGKADPEEIKLLQESLAAAGIERSIRETIAKQMEDAQASRPLPPLEPILDALEEVSDVEFLTNLIKDSFQMAMIHGGIEEEERVVLRSILGRFTGDIDEAYDQFERWSQSMMTIEAQGIELARRFLGKH